MFRCRPLTPGHPASRWSGGWWAGQTGRRWAGTLSRTNAWRRRACPTAHARARPISEFAFTYFTLQYVYTLQGGIESRYLRQEVASSKHFSRSCYLPSSETDVTRGTLQILIHVFGLNVAFKLDQMNKPLVRMSNNNNHNNNTWTLWLSPNLQFHIRRGWYPDPAVLHRPPGGPRDRWLGVPSFLQP